MKPDRDALAELLKSIDGLRAEYLDAYDMDPDTIVIPESLYLTVCSIIWKKTRVDKVVELNGLRVLVNPDPNDPEVWVANIEGLRMDEEEEAGGYDDEDGEIEV